MTTDTTKAALADLGQRVAVSYARLEQRVGSDLPRAQKIALHVYRSSRLCGFTGNPYARFW